MDELLKLLESTIEDEATRKALADAIAEDRAGLEANKKTVLDELKQERGSRKKLEETIASLKGAFGDRSPEDVKAMMDRLENDEMARLAAEGKTDELLKKHKEKWEAERKSAEAALQQQIDDLTQEKSSLEEKLTSELIDNRAIAGATKAGALPESLAVVTLLAKSQWKLEDGEPVLRDEKGEIVTGKSGAMTFDEWASTRLRETHPYLFPTPAGGNAPGGGNHHQSKANPWKKEERNITEQARIKRDNPDLAKRLMSEAGITE